MTWKRRDWFASLAFLTSLTTSLPTPSYAFVSTTQPSRTPLSRLDSSSSSSSTTTTTEALPRDATTTTATTSGTKNVWFQDLSLTLNDFDTTVPVACWWPDNTSTSTSTSSSTSDDDDKTTQQQRQQQPVRASYAHRISVQRIGQLLAQWDFIPGFASRNFVLEPGAQHGVYQGTLMNGPLAFQGPVVILAHGYLGSRFDLSHLAETLGAQGFLCLAPEYPESLAASYERQPGLDRSVINQALLGQLSSSAWPITGTSFGIVGHSLGTGTALNTGDETWARVCLAGFPRQRNGASIPGNLLLICSLNDGAMNLQRFGGAAVIPSDYTLLNKDTTIMTADATTPLPSRAAWILDGPTAPNHISFLSASVNDAMIDLLSPLLPVAQVANIPVLDFDKYQASRDAAATAAALHPVIVRYLKQEMKVS